MKVPSQPCTCDPVRLSLGHGHAALCPHTLAKLEAKRGEFLGELSPQDLRPGSIDYGTAPGSLFRVDHMPVGYDDEVDEEETDYAVGYRHGAEDRGKRRLACLCIGAFFGALMGGIAAIVVLTVRG